jgi:hypothetical protein
MQKILGRDSHFIWSLLVIVLIVVWATVLIILFEQSVSKLSVSEQIDTSAPVHNLNLV